MRPALYILLMVWTADKILPPTQGLSRPSSETNMPTVGSQLSTKATAPALSRPCFGQIREGTHLGCSVWPSDLTNYFPTVTTALALATIQITPLSSCLKPNTHELLRVFANATLETNAMKPREPKKAINTQCTHPN